MSTDSRRSPRLIDYLPLDVWVIRTVDHHPLAGPFAGRIIDISTHGACLLMTQVLQQHVHVFHTTRTSDDLVLQLAINLDVEPATYLLTARPVWLSAVRQRHILAFKMGVEFTIDPDKEQMRELRQALHANQEQRANWWQRHSHLLHPSQSSSS